MTNVLAVWKELAKKNAVSKEDLATLCILKGMHKGDDALAKRKLNQSFAPITNTKKLENGAYPRVALWFALRGAHSSKIAGSLTPEEREELKKRAYSLCSSRYGEVNLA
jgi:hypothetical protein